MAMSVGSLPEINVTPLIDVLLVLLIIFMVISPVAPRGLGSSVPQPGNAAPMDRATGPVVLEMQSGDISDTPVRYRLDGRAVAFAELRSSLESALARRAERVVFVRAARGLSFQPVAAVVGMAREAGAATVALDPAPAR